MKTLAYQRVCAAVLFLAAFFLYSGCNNNTDLPHIGDRVRTSANLVSFSSCDDLEKRLKDNLSEEMRAYLGMMGFKVVINFHGEVIRFEQPSAPAEE